MEIALGSSMRRPRRLTPGARWFVTVRCARSQFRLLPDDERTELFKFLLAKALARCPGVAFHAAAQMSNHFHLVLTDHDSELANLMEYFDGQLARALNAVDRVRGQVFERRYSAIEIVDDDALLDRIVYAITNPVAAGLVRTYHDWPGLDGWFGKAEVLPCACFRWRAHRRAVDDASRLGQPRPSREDFTDRVDLVFTATDAVDVERVRNAILNREERIADAHSGDVLGARAVLEVDPFDSPRRSKRGPMPLCHASTRETWMAFRDGWRRFVGAYREASQAFRRGAVSAWFPAHTFRPMAPLKWPLTRDAAA